MEQATENFWKTEEEADKRTVKFHDPRTVLMTRQASLDVCVCVYIYINNIKITNFVHFEPISS
jgi:hypothetical protein